MLKNQSDQNQISNLSRRAFLGSAAATAAAFTIVPSHVIAGTGTISPNEKMNIAVVGLGMGAANLNAIKETENVVALCDVDQSRLRKIHSENPKAKIFTDYRKMLDKMGNKIDGVIIATPDHTHAVVAMAAMQMGKHVYVQKPLTRSIHECRILHETAKHNKVITQMGNQGRSHEGVRMICEWIWSGAIGKVTEVHAWTDRCWRDWYQNQWGKRPEEAMTIPKGLDWDLWLGPAPKRPYHECYHPGRWRAWWDFGTGALGDMGCHVLDPVYWALDLVPPISVEASRTHHHDEMFPYASIIHYQFPARKDLPPVKMHWYDGGLLPERPEILEDGRRLGDQNGGVLFVGDKGTLMCGCYASNPRIIPESKMKEFTLPPKTIERIDVSHEMNWVQACKGGKPATSNFDVAAPFTEIVLMGNLAVRTGQKIYWDSENMKVKNNIPDIDLLINPPYREGWTL